MKDNYPLDWGRLDLFGNPRNQRIIAKYTEERFQISISIQDFSVPGFVKPQHIDEKTIYLSCVLRGRKYSSRSVYVFRTIGKDSPENRAEAEAMFERLLCAKNKMTNKRPKESEKFLNSLA